MTEKITQNQKEYRRWKISERRRIIKKRMIDYKGGKCEVCGYSKSSAAMDFHHINSTEKDYAISKISNRKWEFIEKELKKCMLVCSNCHREIHEEINIKNAITKENKIRESIKKIIPIYVNCFVCNNKMRVSPTILKRHKRYFCSKTCRENASPASIHRHKKNKKCIDCSADISKRAIRCRKCNSKSTNTHPTKIIWPPIEKLVIMVKNEGYSSVGRKLKVSDNSVRKRLKSNGKL